MKPCELSLADEEADNHRLVQAIVLYEEGHYHKVLAEVEELIHQYPLCFAAHLLKSGALAALGRWQEALSFYTCLLVNAPQEARAAIHVAIGQILENLHRYAEALLAYHEATCQSPDFALAWACLGDMFLHFSRYHDALNSYKNALRLETGDAILHYNYAQVLTVLAQFEQAAQAFLQARYEAGRDEEKK